MEDSLIMERIISVVMDAIRMVIRDYSIYICISSIQVDSIGQLVCLVTLNRLVAMM